MVTHPKINILPKPFPLGLYEWTNEPNNVEVYARQYIENNTFPPSVYYNEVLDYLHTNGYKKYAWKLSNRITLENIKAGKGIKPLRVSSTKAKEKEKTIIPRAEDARAKANKIFKFNFINRILYLLASYRIKREINYAIRHKESHIFILNDDWRICYFPELIDRLKYLGYRVNKNIFGSYYVYWGNEYPGKEI